MGVVTWKNIAPSNPAGILSAANQAAKAMGEGFSGVGTALQGGVDKKVQSETDSFVAELMGLETQAERDAMIADAETAWLNIDTINKTNYELGAPQREMDMFNEKLAAETVVNQAAAKLLAENRLKEIELTNKYKSTTKKSTKQGNTGNVWGASPTGSDGIFQQTHGLDDQWWMGSGYDQDDEIHFDKSKNLLLGNNYAREYNISAEEINQLANDNIIRFKDQWPRDTFVFQGIDGADYELDDSASSQEALIDLVFYHYRRGTDSPNTPGISPRMESQNEYFKVFRDNNPTLADEKGLDGARDLFDQIYARNVKGDNRQTFNKNLANEIFALLPTDAKALADLTQDDSEQRVTASSFSAGDSSHVIANEIKGMDQPTMQKLYDDLIAKQKAYENGGKTLSQDETELIKQLNTRLNELKLSGST